MADTDDTPTNAKILPEWIDTPNCHNHKCQTEFTFFVRRHHCRYCGNNFCDTCSNKRHQIPISPKYPEEERVCDSCFDRLEFEKSNTKFNENNMNMSKPFFEKSDICKKCSIEFSFTNRVHHCRCCGGAFCDDHSKKRVLLPIFFGYQGQQRVCDSCFFYLAKTEFKQDPNQTIPEPDYDQIETKFLDIANDMMSYPADSWITRESSNDIIVYSKEFETSSIQCLKIKATIPLDSKHVFLYVKDKKNYPLWNAMITDIRSLDHPRGEESDLVYTYLKLPVINDRDTITYSRHFPNKYVDKKKGELMDEEGAYTIIATSVETPLCPCSPPAIRAHVFCNMTIIRPIGPSDCDYENFLHTDPLGAIPPALINQMTSQSHENIVAMREFFVNKYKQEMQALSNSYLDATHLQ